MVIAVVGIAVDRHVVGQRRVHEVLDPRTEEIAPEARHPDRSGRRRGRQLSASMPFARSWASASSVFPSPPSFRAASTAGALMNWISSYWPTWIRLPQGSRK